MVEGLPTVESVLHCIKLSTDGAHLLCQDGEVEAGGTEVQGYLQLHKELEVSLGYIKFCLFFFFKRNLSRAVHSYKPNTQEEADARGFL